MPEAKKNSSKKKSSPKNKEQEITNANIEPQLDMDETLKNVKNLMKEIDSTGTDHLNIELDETLTIADVRDFHAIWSSYLNDDRDISINTANLNQVDTAGLQLLLAFVQAKLKQGKQVRWTGQSKSFEDVIQTLNMEQGLSYAP